jgi:hypothetical protein
MAALSGVLLHSGRASGKTPTRAAFADEHDFGVARAFDTLCLIYGSDPRRYAGLAAESGLPESRRATCRYDYPREVRSWRRLLGPWLTHHGRLLPVPD